VIGKNEDFVTTDISTMWEIGTNIVGCMDYDTVVYASNEMTEPV